MDSSSYLKKAQNSTINKDGLLGKVLVGNVTQPICVPICVPGNSVSNLLQGISVNHCLVQPRGMMVLVILMNQNNHNIWIWQPLLAAEIHEVDHLPWDYGVDFQPQGDKIEVAFQLIPLADIMANVKLVHDEPGAEP